MVRWLLIAGLAALAQAVPAQPPRPASEAPALLWEACRGGVRTGYTAQEMITACTAIIDSAQGDSKDLSEAYLHRAQAKLAIDAFQDAVKDCDEVLQRDPGLAKAWYLKAVAHWHLRMPAKAYEDVTRAIAVDPAYVDAFVLRAQFNAQEGRNDRALTDLDKALGIASEKDRARILGDRATLYYRAGYCDLAIADYDQILRLKPDNEAVEGYIARLKRLKTRGECKALAPGAAPFPASPEPGPQDDVKQDEGRYNYGVARLKAKDYPNALAAFRELADKGYPVAMLQLGRAYEFGLGVPKDYTEAMRWYRLGADKGDLPCQVAVGRFYLEGYGVPKNYGEAFKYFKQAAEKGHADGQAYLGTMYELGRGVGADKAKAVSLYRLSAFQGSSRGQYLLGLAFTWGTGVKADMVKAYALFSLASAQDFEPATEQLKGLEKYLKPADVARGQALATDCLAASFKTCGI